MSQIDNVNNVQDKLKTSNKGLGKRENRIEVNLHYARTLRKISTMQENERELHLDNVTDVHTRKC